MSHGEAASMTARDRLGSKGKEDILRPRAVMVPKSSRPPKVCNCERACKHMSAITLTPRNIAI